MATPVPRYVSIRKDTTKGSRKREEELSLVQKYNNSPLFTPPPECPADKPISKHGSSRSAVPPI